MASRTSLSESVSLSYTELAAAAGALNLVSDALGKAVSDIDEGLKKLNLGITTWVRISISGPNYDLGDSRYFIEELGYAKIGSKWGISLKNRSGDEQLPDDDEDIDLWPFNEAPRALRLKAIEKIPDLIKQLSIEASQAARDVQAKLADAQSVAFTLNPPPHSAAAAIKPRPASALPPSPGSGPRAPAPPPSVPPPPPPVPPPPPNPHIFFAAEVKK